jgi:hypothetical protein
MMQWLCVGTLQAGSKCPDCPAEPKAASTAPKGLGMATKALSVASKVAWSVDRHGWAASAHSNRQLPERREAPELTPLIESAAQQLTVAAALSCKSTPSEQSLCFLALKNP